MKKFMCVIEVVKKIHDHSEEEFKGTSNEDDWYFYHDALTQMTSKSTVDWMKEKGYYKRWLIPQRGLNDWMQYYKSRPVGNCPEFMPLDNSLFNDLQQSLSLHCAMTAHLPDIDPRKFSMATPKTIVCGIERLWCQDSGSVPPSLRIIADIDRAIDAFGIVYMNKGHLVKGLANRSGHRNHIE